MRIIPVLDILHSVVVRGVAGDRAQYRPVQSALVNSAEPVAVAAAIRAAYGFHDLYVADLDGIQGRGANRTLYPSLKSPDGELLIDAGVKTPAEALSILAAGADRVIVGLESCPHPDRLSKILQAVGPERVTFSLDLRGGQSLGNAEWPSDPLTIAREVIVRGVQSLIVLDLSGVGVAQGIPTLPLCRSIRALAPALELITGGGLRSAADLAELDQLGINGVLVASALHQRAAWLLTGEDSGGERPA